MSNKKQPPIIEIKNPLRSWWAGDERVEKYMPPVIDAIKRHVKYPSPEFTDIYNRAYEAVYSAIIDMDNKANNEPHR